MLASCVCIPVYKKRLSYAEELNLNESIRHINNFQVFFIGPSDLDYGYYRQFSPSCNILTFDVSYFDSPRSYSKLLLSEVFYAELSQYEFLLILQTDALIFKPELEYWIEQNYDYIGAPWASGIDFPFNFLTPSFPKNYSLRPIVGNGGFSLRRVLTCRRILSTYPDAAKLWSSVGNPEDVFFGMACQIMAGVRLPNLVTAASFSIETNPSVFLPLLGGKSPFGCHAFESYESTYWRSQPFWPKNL